MAKLMSNTYKKLNIHISKAVTESVTLGTLTDTELSLLILLLSAESVSLKDNDANMTGHRHLGLDGYFTFDNIYANWFINGDTVYSIRTNNFRPLLDSLNEKLHIIFKDTQIYEYFIYNDKETEVKVKFTKDFKDKYMNITAGNYFIIDVDEFMKLSKRAKILYLYLSVYNNENTNAFKNYGYAEVYFTTKILANIFNCSNMRKDNIFQILTDVLKELQKVYPCICVISSVSEKNKKNTTKYYIRWMPKSYVISHKLNKTTIKNMLQEKSDRVIRRQTQRTKALETRAEKYKNKNKVTSMNLETDDLNTFNEKDIDMNKELENISTVEEKEKDLNMQQNIELQQLVEIIEQQKNLIFELQKQIQDIKNKDVVTNTENVETDVNAIVEEALEKQKQEMIQEVVPLLEQNEALENEVQQLQAHIARTESLLKEKHIPFTDSHTESYISFIFEEYKKLTKTYGGRAS